MLSALLLVVIISGFLLVREYFLYQGVKEFKRSVVTLNQEGQTAVAECNQRAESVAVSSGINDTILQLRFTSNKDYVLEVICAEFAFDPIEIGSYSLNPYITKKPGTSGIVLNQGLSAVELAVFEDIAKEIGELLDLDLQFLVKTQIVGVENSYVTEIIVGDDLGVGPLTSCEGYGFKCCDPVAEIGIGEKMENVQGCESGCFQACTTRPAVVSFTSNPFFDVATRQVRVQPGEIIDFNYVVDPGNTQLRSVLIDFGDGKTEQLVTDTGAVGHAYTCATSGCTYTASVQAVDEMDNTSVTTSISQLTIVVGTPAPEAEVTIN